MNGINKKDFNIIEIDTRNHSLLNFDITKEQKKDLFLLGYNDTIMQLTCIESKNEYKLKQIDNISEERREKIKKIEDKIKELQEELIKEKNNKEY